MQPEMLRLNHDVIQIVEVVEAALPASAIGIDLALAAAGRPPDSR